MMPGTRTARIVMAAIAVFVILGLVLGSVAGPVGS
jgi:hypothetical protein